MADENKLPLIKLAFEYLLKKLREEDNVAIVVYASQAGVALSPTSGADKSKITNAIEKLKSGGSTAGGAGINAAYAVAEEIYSENATNRVILATDGDFNVGVSSNEGLVNLIKQKRDKGIFLSVMGFGMGNYKDSKMEALADNGNGNYYYIDSPTEARRVFLREFGGTIFTVAKDVKIQVEFNPAMIKAYRLIRYENRILDNQDFNLDTTDAGEMGLGQTVTAFYELIPSMYQETIPGTDSLRYQVQQQIPDTSQSNEFFYVKIRYKNPDNSNSILITSPAGKECFTDSPSSDFLFASAVTEFGLLVRPSDFKCDASFQHVISIAEENTGTDPKGRRSEFVALVKEAWTLER
jgi:Ca-activated chloride channel family protein